RPGYYPRFTDESVLKATGNFEENLLSCFLCVFAPLRETASVPFIANSTANIQLGTFGFELRDAVIGDFGSGDPQEFERWKFCKGRQPGVVELRAVQFDRFQSRTGFQIRESRSLDRSVIGV